MDKTILKARVKCLGKYHTVGLSLKGRIRLFDHTEGDDEAIAVMLLLNPDERCRCHEVRDAWGWYTKGNSPNFYELRDSHPWVERAFVNSSWGTFEAPTDSKLLSIIPKPFQDKAREAKETGTHRRRRNRYNSISPQPFLERVGKKGDWNRRRALSDFRDRRGTRILKKHINRHPGKDVYEARSPDNLYDIHKGRTWWKVCESVGVLPKEVPPLGLWKTEGEEFFPPFLKVMHVAPLVHPNHSMHKTKTYWARLTFNGEAFSLISCAYEEGT